MLTSLIQKVFPSANDRAVKAFAKNVDAINALEDDFIALDDDALKAKTDEFRGRLEKGESEDDLLIEAFATVREAAKRVLGMRHFDVQLVGGMVLHQGAIAEMKTGEGKTLVATLPVYLNALSGKGVHVVTVNDYLAKRDASWMGQVYEFLGLTVDCLVPGMQQKDRKAAYACDIMYATNNELGFDYLRDNMKHDMDQMVGREYHYTIIDEVDSILIDEARTPLIISGPTEDSSELYKKTDKIIPLLDDTDYEKDEKQRSVALTDEGAEHVEEILREKGLLEIGSLYDAENITLLHHVNQALRAHKLFTKDTDYIVANNKVIIIDEFTGRMMEGRRYGEGLHQALEAKEGAKIQVENQTLASITFQNFFRMYPKMAGMTGTALTEEAEFMEIYGLKVIEIPTHRPLARLDEEDEIYRDMEQKYAAMVKVIREANDKKQPVLVGTVSIEKSEYLAKLLKKEKIPHNVLNAKMHAQEAEIVLEAGRPGAVTIATNMAGRGTDIQLGGNLEVALQAASKIKDKAKKEAKEAEIRTKYEEDKQTVLDAGGLFVIGTERHESRRIDNQLRGRSGRQGDPGRSKFYLSLEDDLMRIFGGMKLENFMQRMNINSNEAITHPWISKALEKAQKRVEGRNFDIRKNLLKFDDVMNDQRQVVYEQRREIIQDDDVSDVLKDMRLQVIEDAVDVMIPNGTYPEHWDTEGLTEYAKNILALDVDIKAWSEEDGVDKQTIHDRLVEMSDTQVSEMLAKFAPEMVKTMQRAIILNIMDAQWKDHLLALDHLRQGINLRAYGQKDPLNEYKSEAFQLFANLLGSLRENATGALCHFEQNFRALENFFERGLGPDMQESHPGADRASEYVPGMAQPKMQMTPGQRGGAGATVTNKSEKPFDKNDPQTWGKTRRNDPCPCGSGLKYKHCHGKL